MLSSTLVSVIPAGERSYSVATPPAGLTLAATPTDVFTITGAVNFVQRLQRLVVTGLATAAGVNVVQLIKRSVANTGGTAQTLVPTLRDATSGPPMAFAAGSAPSGLNQYLASAALVQTYTANPGALGTATAPQGGPISMPRLLSYVAAASLAGPELVWDFTQNLNLILPTLRGPADVIALNFNGAAIPAGAIISVEAHFTEVAAQPGALS